jgi:hypothetical protein
MQGRAGQTASIHGGSWVAHASQAKSKTAAAEADAPAETIAPLRAFLRGSWRAPARSEDASERCGARRSERA